MTKYMQSSPMVVDVAGRSFEETVQSTSARMVRASRFGQVDPGRVATLVHGPGRRHGAHLALPVTYDFHHQSGRTGPAPAVTGDLLRRAAIGSRFTWSDAVVQEKLGLYLQVNELGAEANIAVWVDTHYLSRLDVVTIAFETERLLVEVAVAQPN
jgi:hypothetical protein